jgi:hypothetical protein
MFGQIEDEKKKDGSKVVVIMKNGDTYKGEILSRDSESILLKTVNGEISLIESRVRSIEKNSYKNRKKNQRKKGSKSRFKFDNPHDTRYFFGPSGIPIEKGGGYYQNILVVFNFANYGISDNISIGGGLEFLSTVSGSPIWFLTPKAGFPIGNNMHLGGGFIMAGLAGVGSGSLGYGVFTYGTHESNVSAGIGYGFINGELGSSPTLVFSGTHRTSNSTSLLTENYIISSGTGESIYFGIHGLRILSEKSSFDLGAIIIPELLDVIPALPYVGFVRVF